MQRDGHGVQLGQPIGIHLALGRQDADHHAIGPEFLGHGDVALHDLELVVGVHEVAHPRAHEHVHRHEQAFEAAGNQPGTGRRAAVV